MLGGGDNDRDRERKAIEAKHREKAEKYATMNDEERDEEENGRVAKKLEKMEGMTKDERESIWRSRS